MFLLKLTTIIHVFLMNLIVTYIIALNAHAGEYRLMI
ncbi:hypothetical protein SDC9_121439 [bioreactor metagenome]|uniref:Uncharacterized protein n=1 Tax=bioreactor metagenome TaxID=1076179 RepID=A0A645CC00_9ZZZZ